MAKAMKVCKVCGKEYPYCKTWNSSNVFRYQDVTCSVECGEIFLARVLESRSKTANLDERLNESVETSK